jgi:hypothetical protein
MSNRCRYSDSNGTFRLFVVGFCSLLGSMTILPSAVNLTHYSELRSMTSSFSVDGT